MDDQRPGDGLDAPPGPPGDREPGASRRAARNIGARAVAEVTGLLASLALFASLARAEGQDGLGLFVLAFAVALVVLLPIGLGLDRYIVRQMSRDLRLVDGLFANAIALKLVVATPLLVATVLVSALVTGMSEATGAITLAAISVTFYSLNTTVSMVLAAYEKAG